MIRASTIAVALVSVAHAAAAQLPNSSTRALALGSGYTASAKGFEAIAWNPALLAMPGRPVFSLNLIQFGAGVGSNSYGLSDFKKYSNKLLTTADKDSLLAKVRQGDPNRTLALSGDLGVTGLALSLGNFAVSASGAADVRGDVSADAIELALYGNVTRRAAGQTYTLTGSGAKGWGGGTLALAYGMKLPVPVGALGVGATLKINKGSFGLRAADINTSLQTNPNFDARVGFHALMTDIEASKISNGSGFGLDLGGAYQLPGGLRVGLVVENIVQKMSWSDANLVYYRKQFRLTQNGDVVTDTTIADIEKAAYNASDPMQKALRDSLDTGTNPTRIRAGVNYSTGMLTLAGGAIINATKGLDISAAKQVGVGLELRLIPFIPLRAGLNTDFAGGTTLSAGFGLKLGPVRMDAALASTTAGDHQGFQGALGLSFMN